MARILTGIQSSGRPHLGNLLGAIIPAIELSKSEKNESLFFIADLHSFTTIRDPKELKDNTYATATSGLHLALILQEIYFTDNLMSLKYVNFHGI